MDDLIYNQRSIPRQEHRYGLRSSAAVGCGWIATYNALRLMGYRTEIDPLIRYFAWQMPLIHGNAGTSFWGPAVCLRQWGFPVKLVLDRRRFDGEIRAAEAAIVFYHWRRGLRMGAHFVAVHSTPQGIVGYNTFSNSTGPDLWGPSAADFMKKRGYFGAVLIAIGKRSRRQTAAPRPTDQKDTP